MGDILFLIIKKGKNLEKIRSTKGADFRERESRTAGKPNKERRITGWQNYIDLEHKSSNATSSIQYCRN